MILAVAMVVKLTIPQFDKLLTESRISLSAAGNTKGR